LLLQENINSAFTFFIPTGTQKVLRATGVGTCYAAFRLTNLVNCANACTHHINFLVQQQQQHINGCICVTTTQQSLTTKFVTMPKSKHTLPPLQCPNRLCPSCPPVFKNLYKHISQRPDCLAFIQSLRQSMLHKSKELDIATMPAATIMSSTNTVVCPFLIDNPNRILPDQMSLDNQLPFQDDAQSDDCHDATQYQASSDDYKQANFDAFVGPDELEQLCNPA
jgi:hypothetical protein